MHSNYLIWSWATTPALLLLLYGTAKEPKQTGFCLAKMLAYTETGNCVKRHGAFPNLNTETRPQAEELNCCPHLHQRAERNMVLSEIYFLPGQRMDTALTSCGKETPGYCKWNQGSRRVNMNILDFLRLEVLPGPSSLSLKSTCPILLLFLPHSHHQQAPGTAPHSPLHLSVSPAERQTCRESCWEAGPQKFPMTLDSQAQGAWEAQRQWLITKWGCTGSMERV